MASLKHDDLEVRYHPVKILFKRKNSYLDRVTTRFIPNAYVQ